MSISAELFHMARFFLPEAVLLGTAMAVLLSELTYHRERFRLISGVAAFGFLTAILLQLGHLSTTASGGGGPLLFGFFTEDAFGSLFRLLFQILGLGVVIAASTSFEVARLRHAEFLVFVCVSVLSASLLVASNHLLVVWVCAQMLGFSLQFLATFQKRSSLSVEAGLKTWAAQWMATICFLLAVVMFYSAFHHLDLSGMRDVVKMSGGGGLAWLGFAFLALSVFAWIGLFPFHSWVPDAATGMPVPALGVTLWLGPLAGAAFLLRFYAQAGQWIQGPGAAIPLLSALPMFSAVVAVLAAGQQASLKRVFAFLCAARWGLWVAVTPELNSEMFGGLLLAAITELPAMAGVFFSLGLLRDRHGSSELGRMAGAARRFLPESFALLFFLAVSVGLPPFPGFVGLYLLISGLFHHGADALAWLSLGVLAVSWAVFLRVGLVLSRDKRAGDVVSGRVSGALGRAYLLFLALPIVMIGIYAEGFLKWVSHVVFPTVW